MLCHDARQETALNAPLFTCLLTHELLGPSRSAHKRHMGTSNRAPAAAHHVLLNLKLWHILINESKNDSVHPAGLTLGQCRCPPHRIPPVPHSPGQLLDA
jgi:hypothetical protein